MKITRIETRRVRVPVDRGVGLVADKRGFRFESDLLLLVIETDSDLCGVGEVTASPDWSGETSGGAQVLIDEYMAPRLLGKDPRKVDECMDLLHSIFANPFAKAAIEMALFDLLGKSCGSPIFEILGGAVRDPILPVRFPLMPVGPAESAECAMRMKQKGFRTIKLKVGRDSVAMDLERIRVVRDAVGADQQITIDANGGWTVEETIQAAPQLKELDVLFVEQPVDRMSLEALAEVRSKTGLAIMADESVFTVADAERCLSLRAADIISVYPGKNGGLRNTMKIAEMSTQFDVKCAIGSNLEWDVASAALAHAAAACDNICVELYDTDIIGPIFHTERAIDYPLLVGDSSVRVPGGVGLGVQLV